LLPLAGGTRLLRGDLYHRLAREVGDSDAAVGSRRLPQRLAAAGAGWDQERGGAPVPAHAPPCGPCWSASASALWRSRKRRARSSRAVPPHRPAHAPAASLSRWPRPLERSASVRVPSESAVRGGGAVTEPRAL